MATWKETGSGKDSADVSGAPLYGIEFNSAKSSGIYNGSTLQPKACQTLIIIKAWKALGWTVVASPNIAALAEALNSNEPWFVVHAPALFLAFPGLLTKTPPFDFIRWSNSP